MVVERTMVRRGCRVARNAVPSSGFSSLLRVAVIVAWTLKILNEQEGVDAITLPPVNWNSSNPMFKSSKNDHVIQVKPYDDLDFVCPYHPRHEDHQGDREETEEEGDDAEGYYTVYMVSKVEYDDCNIYSESQVVMMLNCSSPWHRKRFTILFEPFPSIPNVPEYQPGATYYFVSTSTGVKGGLGNLYQGACSHHNMKVTIRICCDHNAAKHTNAILPDMTSVYQRKNGHHQRTLPVNIPNHRRSRLHVSAEEHNGKHRTGAFQSFGPTSQNPILKSPSVDRSHEGQETARNYVETPDGVFDQEDAVQDSLVHSRGSHAFNCDIYVHIISLLLSASIVVLQLRINFFSN